MACSFMVEENEEMKKRKIVFLVIVIIILLAGILLYFRPLQLSVPSNKYISAIYEELGVRDGEPYINDTTYNEITEDEKEQIIDLLEQYSYRRTPGTLFSDGSLTETGDQILIMHIFDENNELDDTIIITGADSISVNGKNYFLNNSPVCIEELLNILNK